MSSLPPSYPAYAAYPPTNHPTHNSNDSQSSLSINTKTPFIGDSSFDLSTRTPSPTRSEFNYLNDIKEKKTVGERIRFYAILAVLLTAVILFSVFHTQIINGLKPVTDWLHDHSWGPVIPILILIILSFPPLFGHELVVMLTGITWSFPEACAIVAIGTLLGEIANYFVFKYACTARVEKMEKTNIAFGMLAHLVRTKGFWLVLVIRYSAIPPHFATTVFATVGIKFGVFIAAAVLSLPKAFVPVYVGYAMKPENKDNKTADKVEKIVLVITIAITVASFIWINRQIAAAKEEYIHRRRKGRQHAGKNAPSSSAPQFVSMPEV
ncbi:hypothetical protein R3P38DRAFT_2935277 [Favolaschia claudopus]|uniref:Golgi apparatus membrane protein TVP38 n=1 Tax=Favolaschia claudopus TaxID=2862362 RepID=A0AAW0BPC0_9AGAR